MQVSFPQISYFNMNEALLYLYYTKLILDAALNLFSKDEFDMGCARRVQHQIHLQKISLSERGLGGSLKFSSESISRVEED